MLSKDARERTRRLRAETIVAASRDIGVFLYGVAAAVVVVGALRYEDETWAGICVYVSALLLILGGVVQFLGPRLFGPS